MLGEPCVDVRARSCRNSWRRLETCMEDPLRDNNVYNRSEVKAGVKASRSWLPLAMMKWHYWIRKRCS